MPSRSFNGTTDRLTMAIGGNTGFTFGTVAAILNRPVAGAFHTWMGLHTSGGTGRAAWQVDSGDEFSWWNGSAARAATFTVPTSVWLLVVMRKATGTAQVRASIYRFDTAAWTHLNAGATIANNTSPGASGTIAVDYETSEPWRGLLAVRGIWTNLVPWAANTTGDAQIVAAGLHTALANWVTAAPTSVWRFDQAAVTTSVSDLVGTAHQSARTGTTVSASVPTGFAFDATPAVAVKQHYYRQRRGVRL